MRQIGDSDRTPPIGLELVRNGDLYMLVDNTDPKVRLVYTPAEIDAFLHGAKAGDFDHLVYSKSVTHRPQ